MARKVPSHEPRREGCCRRNRSKEMRRQIVVLVESRRIIHRFIVRTCRQFPQSQLTHACLGHIIAFVDKAADGLDGVMKLRRSVKMSSLEDQRARKENLSRQALHASCNAIIDFLHYCTPPAWQEPVLKQRRQASLLLEALPPLLHGFQRRLYNNNACLKPPKSYLGSLPGSLFMLVSLSLPRV